MKKKNTNFWFIVDHPQQLAIAISISRYIKTKNLGKSILLVSKHEYWKRVEIDDYKKFFSKIILFQRADFPPPTMSKLKQILASLLLFFQLLLLKIKVKRLDVKDGDVLLGFSTIQMLEDVMISSFPKTRKIAILPEATWLEQQQSKKMLEEKKGTYTLGGYFFRFLYAPLLGLTKIDCSIRKGVTNLADGDFFQNYSNDLKEIYNKILILVNITSPKIKNGYLDNIKYSPFPYIYNVNKKVKGKKKIVFFSMPFMKEYGISKHSYIKRVDEYLDFLRKTYKQKYNLEYRPHPQETDEYKSLNLSNFRLAKDRKIAELYLSKEGYRIKSVFSIFSTTSRSALNFGINSYVFPKLYPLRPSVFKTYQDLFGDVPMEFYLKDLKTVPKQIKSMVEKDVFSTIFEKDFSWAINKNR